MWHIYEKMRNPEAPREMRNTTCAERHIFRSRERAFSQSTIVLLNCNRISLPRDGMTLIDYSLIHALNCKFSIYILCYDATPIQRRNVKHFDTSRREPKANENIPPPLINFYSTYNFVLFTLRVAPCKTTPLVTARALVT